MKGNLSSKVKILIYISFDSATSQDLSYRYRPTCVEFCIYKNIHCSNVGNKEQLSPPSGDWLEITSCYVAIKKNEEALMYWYGRISKIY